MYTIIGNGLVGAALHTQLSHSTLYDRVNSLDLPRYSHDVLVVAAPTGNRLAVSADPSKDLLDCKQLAQLVMECDYVKLVYISTVDVYPTRSSLNNDPSISSPQAVYGNNRWWLEGTLAKMPNSHIIRLPSLIDQSLKKNLLYDLKTGRWLHKICLDSCLQWYPLQRLGDDLTQILLRNRRYQNLTSPPIPNREIVQTFFPKLLSTLENNQLPAVYYDVRNQDGDYEITLDETWKSFSGFFNTTEFVDVE